MRSISLELRALGVGYQRSCHSTVALPSDRKHLFLLDEVMFCFQLSTKTEVRAVVTTDQLLTVCKEKLALSLHATVSPTTSRSSNGSTYQKLPNKINTCDTNHADIMAFLDWVDFPKRTPLPISPPSAPLNQFVRMIADTSFNIKTDRATIVRGIRQFSVLWLPIGRIGGSRFFRIVPCIYGLRPEVPPSVDFEDIFPQSVLGVDDNIRPGTAFHSCGEKLPDGKANLSGPGDLDAGGFNCFQLEILQSLGGEIDKPLSYEDVDEGEWCSTRFYAVVRFGPDGLERGITLFWIAFALMMKIVNMTSCLIMDIPAAIIS
ncbi:hypothetical protein CPC735_069300 [Coccidioides posadasii C735 delta SOWgp]|uniref:Uncharacterized protein n=1 Tax=Coccidioides posadasii (strain C735) TaxID=222929 RepID=C5P0P0_COCP7|nr:hypothetical protein CPC735_069300 [Coccidioides posadasii C735 delta SOWgp]EER29248.1 hypothetical protein CPC735_069300 [Coccidioides posadasii C735 delta SOWgp]|eukprot:XP_003071393.1 hypothetical protein CPC735_069300 [Coccidioides posadasii C735 delta SOWgp]